MPNASVNVNVISASTGQPVQSAIYVNGSYTSNLGAASLAVQVPQGQTTEVKAVPINSDGSKDNSRAATRILSDQDSNATITVPDSLPSPATLTLEAPANSSGVSVSLAGPPDSNGNPISQQGTTDDNGQLTFANLPAGDYTYSASHPAYQDLSQQPISLAAGQTATAGMPMVAKTSPQAIGGSLPVSDNGANASSNTALAGLADAQSQDAAFDQVYSNTSWDTYFTSAQCRVYIGDLFIDELQAIQYSAPNNIIPVHGYASRFADAWADGKSLIQGQLILNYVSETYMYTVLANYRRFLVSQSVPSAAADATSQSAQQLGNALKARKYLLASSEDADTTAIDSTIQTLVQDPATVQQHKQNQQGRGPGSIYINAIYQPIAFDIRVEIGSGSSRTYRQLEKCRLTGNDQIIDQSGNVIADVYSFLARRLR